MSEFVYIGMCGTPTHNAGRPGCCTPCKRIAHGTPRHNAH